MLFTAGQVQGWAPQPETVNLRNKFEAKKQQVRKVASEGRFKSKRDREAAAEFIAGRKEPDKVNSLCEGSAQRKFREGIEEMEELLESAAPIKQSRPKNSRSKRTQPVAVMA